MRHIKARSYFLFILSIILALSGPFSSLTFFAQNSFALDDATLEIFAENNIMFYDPDEQDCISSKGTSRPSGDQITWIGDSYSVSAKNEIEKKLPGVDFGESDSYIEVGRTVEQGLTILNGIGKDNLRPYLVFALGTNSLWNSTQITKISDPTSGLVNEDTKIILVTSRTENGIDYTASNNLLKKAAEDNKNIFIADWADDSVYKSEYYASDPEHIHPYDGWDAWVNVIYNALPSGSARAITGETAEEIVWSILINQGFSEIQTAGIMGNIYVESWFNPVENSGIGAQGLFSWLDNGRYDRWSNMKKILENEGYEKYLNNNYNKYHYATYNESYKYGSGNPIPLDDLKNIISLEIKYAMEYGAATNGETWIKEVKQQTTVVSATEAFLTRFEGAVETAEVPGQPIEEYTPFKGIRYQGRDARVKAANWYYENFTGLPVSSTGCNDSINLSSDDVLALLQQFVIDSNYLYNETNTIPSSYELNKPLEPPIDDSSTPTPSDEKIRKLNLSGQDATAAKTGCWYATYCGQCTALSGWFVTMMTSYSYYGGNGGEVASKLADGNSLQISPKPTPYSVFSGATHTGVVLEVFDNGEILSIENNMGGSANKLEVHRWKPNDTYSFVNLSNGVDLSHLRTTYE